MANKGRKVNSVNLAQSTANANDNPPNGNQGDATASRPRRLSARTTTSTKAAPKSKTAQTIKLVSTSSKTTWASGSQIVKQLHDRSQIVAAFQNTYAKGAETSENKGSSSKDVLRVKRKSDKVDLAPAAGIISKKSKTGREMSLPMTGDESESDDPKNAVRRKYSKGNRTLALSNDTDNEDMMEGIFKDIEEDLKAAGVEDLKAAGVETVEGDDDNMMVKDITPEQALAKQESSSSNEHTAK